MSKTIPGIHHVTAIAGGAQRNVDFYTGLLGLRLVKRTVNFDDPGTWHLYYGDEAGHPGTIMTFFPWEAMARGRQGTGTTSATSFLVPAPSLERFWVDRLAAAAIDFEAPEDRFGAAVLRLTDPDGMPLELVAAPDVVENAGWGGGFVPAEHGVRGFGGVALSLQGFEQTGRLLTEVFGWEEASEENGRFRFRAPGDEFGNVVDILPQPNRPPARMGAGSVHHVAFRARDEGEQLEWREQLVKRGFDVTPVVDRQYFRSIYFHEPGGVLFEIATDSPGFLTDEPRESLGESLKLPPWLEDRRDRIEASLPPIRVPLPTRERA